MTKIIESYTGQHDFLSVRYPSPITIDGVLYPTVEHAYLAQRTSDDSRRRAIARAPSIVIAVNISKRSTVRPMWYSIRLRVVEDLLRLKFELKELREKLLETGDAVLAGRVIDTGVDSNQMMMQLREELRDIYRRV